MLTIVTWYFLKYDKTRSKISFKFHCEWKSIVAFPSSRFQHLPHLSMPKLWSFLWLDTVHFTWCNNGSMCKYFTAYIHTNSLHTHTLIQCIHTQRFTAYIPNDSLHTYPLTHCIHTHWLTAYIHTDSLHTYTLTHCIHTHWLTAYIHTDSPIQV